MIIINIKPLINNGIVYPLLDRSIRARKLIKATGIRPIYIKLDIQLGIWAPSWILIRAFNMWQAQIFKVCGPWRWNRRRHRLQRVWF